jgi:hypothetical protein
MALTDLFRIFYLTAADHTNPRNFHRTDHISGHKASLKKQTQESWNNLLYFKRWLWKKFNGTVREKYKKYINTRTLNNTLSNDHLKTEI